MRLTSIVAGVALAAALSAPAMAEGLMDYDATHWAMSPFSGLNVGVYGGGMTPCGCGEIGARVGANAVLDGGLLLGGQIELGIWDVTGNVAGPAPEFVALGKLGFVLNDMFAVYGLGGGGSFGGSNALALGGGVDVAVTDNVIVSGQGEALNFGGGFSEWRANFGLSYTFGANGH